jgi:hypothetical protein
MKNVFSLSVEAIWFLNPINRDRRTRIGSAGFHMFGVGRHGREVGSDFDSISLPGDPNSKLGNCGMPLGSPWPESCFWGGMFHMVGQGYIDTWDIQLVFASMRAGGATATSNVNLTENVGFGPDGTHLIRSPHGVKPVAAMKFPIGEVPLEWDELADTWTRVHHFQVALTARQALRVQNPEFQQFVREVGELDRKRRSQR